MSDRAAVNGRGPRGWARYAWAVAAIAAALLARWFGDPRLGTQLPYGSMLVASVFVAWFAGLGPALVVVVLGGLATNFFLIAPRWSFALAEDQQRWGLVVFWLLGSVIAGFGSYGRTQRARAEGIAIAVRRADVALREARDELERRVEQRTAELARTNASLRGSEERFRVLVEGVRGYAMVMLGGGGAIAAWNGGAERLFGRTAEVVGGGVAQLIPGLDGDALREAAAGGTCECTGVRGDGATFAIELVVTQLDAPELFVAIVHDISERKRLEALTEQKQHRADELRRKTEALEQDNRRMLETHRLQNEFLANMSHELRTPLNAIIGFADLVHGGLTGPINDQQREFLGDILTSSRHLLGLINEILDLAKVESGTVDIAPEPLALAAVLTEVRDILRGTAAARRVELELAPSDGVDTVTVDPGKLRQILYNYVSNAIKFTPEGGRVTIRALPGATTFRLEVEDTGIGIAEDDLRYLFVAFRQLDGGPTKRYGGTGLGLALSKRLAEAQGGSVGVRSVRGAGSTFWVELPRVVVASPRPAR